MAWHEPVSVPLRRLGGRYLKTDVAYLASSGLWTNAHVLAVSISSFALAVAFANLLPQETYGTYQYLLSFSSIAGALTLTGMNYAITQAVARGHEGDIGAAVRTQLQWGMLPLALGILCGGAFALYGSAEIGIGIALTGALVPLANAFNTYAALLNGRKAFKRAFLANCLLLGAYTAAMLLGAILLDSALALLAVNLSVNAIVLIGLYAWTRRTRPTNASRDPEAIGYGTRLSASYVLPLIVRQADAILVFALLGPVALAVYSLAAAIPERLGGFFRTLFTASLPRFSARDADQVRGSMLPKALAVTAAGACAALGYALIAPPLFALVFPQYLASVPYTQAYALILVATAGNLSVSALIARRSEGGLFGFNTAMSIVLLLLQVGLIFPFGIWGMVAARVAGAWIETLASLALVLRGPRA